MLMLLEINQSWDQPRQSVVVIDANTAVISCLILPIAWATASCIFLYHFAEAFLNGH